MKHPTYQLYKKLLIAALVVDITFLVFLPASSGGSQPLLSSNSRLVTFAIISLASIATIIFIRKLNQDSQVFIGVAARLQSNRLFWPVAFLLGISVVAGLNFLVLPAYDAYQILVDIPRLYTSITTLLGWFITQAALLFITTLVMRYDHSPEIAPERINLRQALVLSSGVLFLSLYFSSIFIAWFAQRGFRLF